MKTSARAAARDARAQESRATKEALLSGTPNTTLDSFVNFAQKMGVGADNALSTSRYGFNPITRNRIQLEWVHRGSWLGGVAIDIVADDMTREGVEITSEMSPDDQQAITKCVADMGVWDQFADTIRWGRLYGGAISVILVDGQDTKTPLRLETVGPDQFKGLLVLDRWMLEPTLEDLVTDFGPDLGLPKYYRVLSNAPALRGAVIHHSRVALRHVGVPLPYQQALTENLWGLSIIERLWDRLTMFDSASTGAGQLVFKAWLRTMKIEDLRGIIAAGNKPLEGLTKYMDTVRRYQNLEGITLIDANDELEVQEHGAFSGLADVVDMFAQQVAGALQIPLTRLLGQSPGGLSTDDKSGMRTYYDGIKQQQKRHMSRGVANVYCIAAQSIGLKVPKDFGVDFRSLYQLTPVEQSTVAKTVTEAVGGAFEKGMMTQQAAMKELRQSSRITGIFSNITAEEIEQAEEELTPPSAEKAMELEHQAGQADEDRQHEKELAEADRDHEAEQADADREFQEMQSDIDRTHAGEQSDKERKHKADLTDKQLRAKQKEAQIAGRNRQAGSVAGGPRQRKRL